jgi:hypothetical protein
MPVPARSQQVTLAAQAMLIATSAICRRSHARLRPCRAAGALIRRKPHADRPHRVTRGGDKGFRTTGRPRRSAIDGRTTPHPVYAVDNRIRKRIDPREATLSEDASVKGGPSPNHDPP